MKEATILKPDLSSVDSPDVFDEGVYKLFVAWIDKSGKSLSVVASMMKTSQKRISQYIKKEFVDFPNLNAFEKSIVSFLKHYDRSGILIDGRQILETSVFREIWEVFQLCKSGHYQGLVVGSSGLGKTEACKEFCRRNADTVLLSCDVTIRKPGSFLRMVSEGVGTRCYDTNNTCLTYIIDRLKAHPQILIIDEAHFLTWEMLEVIRRIYDACQISVIYVGQPQLFDQMRGKNKYLYDQILSRIPIKRKLDKVFREDVKMLADSLCPGLDKKCIDFLHERALKQGRFRSMVNLLGITVRVSRAEEKPITLSLLKGVAEACGERI